MAIATASSSTVERAGAAKFKGNPLTLIGPEIKPGAKAPSFQASGQNLAPVTLEASRGRPLVNTVVPSLDPPVCDAQTRRFNKEAAALNGFEILTISMDLPFAQKRWCGAAGIDRVTVLSDYKDASFGTAWGTLIKELRLQSRAVFVVDAGGIVRYAEYVPEVTSHPNYDAALASARSLTNK